MSSEVEATSPPIAGSSGLVGRLYERVRRLIQEFGKFGIVGAVCYFIDLAIFRVCLIVMPWFPALVISTVLAASVAFVGNRYWTWRDRERTALHREYALYFGFNLVGLLISAAVLWVSHDWLGSMQPWLQTPTADIIFGKVIGVGFASLFRFWAYRRYVFKPVTSEI